ncbi:MAG: V-type ATP synthase subunit F [Vicinamibacterales bacterium]
MRLFAIGDDRDARGFRLAGVEAIACRTRRDVERAAAGVAARGAEPGVVLVSEAVYRQAPTAFDALRRRPRWPIVLVLPEGKATGSDGVRVD